MTCLRARPSIAAVLLVPAVLLVLGLLLVLGPLQAPASAASVVRIGMVVDGPWERNAEVLELFRSEILALTEGEFDVRFPEAATRIADWSPGGIRAAFDALLADDSIDLVLCMGTIVSHLAVGRRDLPKPVIAPFVIDASFQQAPLADGASGVENLSYLAIPDHIDRDLRTFREIAPLQHVTVLVNRAMVEAVPELSARFAAQAADLGLGVTEVLVGAEAGPALDAIPHETDGVYLAPLLQLRAGELDRLIAGLKARRLPSFSLLGRSEVERGVLAGLTPPSFFVRVARRVALHVQSILLGDAAGTLPVAITDQERLTINLGTARAIDVWPPWGVLTEAEVIRPERADVPRRLELVTAVREAVQVNLDLAAAERTVAAGAATVREARSPLLPQIEASLTGLLIDADRAASLGAPAERTLRAGGSLSQLIYADGPWAGLAVERHLQTGRELERQTLRLDIAQAAATAYLEVLRAKTFERIQRENLELTRANLEQARVRATIGQAGPEEVYRWESQIATNRRTAIQANARRNLAEIELNRILNRPLEEPFATVEVDLRDPALLSGHAQFDRWLRSPWSFRVLRRVLVDEGLAASPELGRVDAAIAARERAQAAARRAFWLPTVGLQGEVSHLLAEDGAGSEDLDLSGLPVAIPGLEEPDDTDWSVALGATLPLIEGGGRRATLARTSEELERLRLERAALAERVEQRIRSTLHVAGASYASIEQTELAAAAARRNLELVQDAYAQGVVSILDLLDAQNAALVADQAASTAVHDFLIDLMAVERALGRLDVLRTAEEREAWIATVDRALAEARRRDEAP